MTLPMSSISSVGTAAAMQPVATVKDQMTISVMKMEQDQAKADGQTAVRLLAAAAEVQTSGVGGRVDVQG